MIHIDFRYYGWKHLPDGTAEATQWFTLWFLPIVPLERNHLRVLTDPSRESFFSLRTLTEYQILKKLPLAWGNVARTYLNTYLLLPILLAAPIAVLFAISRLVLGNPPRGGEMSAWERVLILLIFAGIFVYWIAVILQAMRRSRGFMTRQQQQALEADREFLN